MKYSIMGFNQANILQLNLNVSEILLLSYIYDAQASPTMSHIIEDGKVYTWLSHSKIQADLPILNINERQLKYYLNHLTSCNLILAKQMAVTGIRGSRAYYGITEICESLRYDNTDTEQGQKIAPNTPLLGAKNCPSDNLLNLDNKLNTIPKGIVAKAPTSTEYDSVDNSLNTLSEYESKMYSEDRRKIRKMDAGEKPKKLSLWDKCVQLIESFTDDEKLQDALKEYLRVRLAMKDKPIFAAQFNALLKKIPTLKGDPLRIVKQSTELGYASFYDEKVNYTRPGNGWTRNKNDICSETDDMNCNKVSEEERREILTNGEVF